MIHLTETGVNAGRRLCPTDRSDGAQSVHAMYAPLENPEFRETVCPECLKVWAMEAYEEGDELPDYILAVRQNIQAQ